MDIDYRLSNPKIVALVMFIYLVGIASMIGIIGWQIVASINRDEIVWLGLIDGFEWLGSEWAANPTSWEELHEIFRWIPLGFSAPIIVFGIGWIIESLFLVPKRTN